MRARHLLQILTGVGLLYSTSVRAAELSYFFSENAAFNYTGSPLTPIVGWFDYDAATQLQYYAHIDLPGTGFEILTICCSGVPTPDNEITADGYRKFIAVNFDYPLSPNSIDPISSVSIVSNGDGYTTFDVRGYAAVPGVLPEPASLTLFGAFLSGLAFARGRARRKA